jgi:hypothetical protein
MFAAPIYWWNIISCTKKAKKCGHAHSTNIWILLYFLTMFAAPIHWWKKVSSNNELVRYSIKGSDKFAAR